MDFEYRDKGDMTLRLTEKNEPCKLRTKTQEFFDSYLTAVNNGIYVFLAYSEDRAGRLNQLPFKAEIEKLGFGITMAHPLLSDSPHLINLSDEASEMFRKDKGICVPYRDKWGSHRLMIINES